MHNIWSWLWACDLVASVILLQHGKIWARGWMTEWTEWLSRRQLLVSKGMTDAECFFYSGKQTPVNANAGDIVDTLAYSTFKCGPQYHHTAIVCLRLQDYRTDFFSVHFRTELVSRYVSKQLPISYNNWLLKMELSVKTGPSSTNACHKTKIVTQNTMMDQFHITQSTYSLLMWTY